MKDGRSRRAVETKRVLMDECKKQMLLGIFRPTAVGVAAGAGRSVRSVFQHWPGMEQMHLDALSDQTVYDKVFFQITARGTGEMESATVDRIIRAAVLGRVMP